MLETSVSSLLPSEPEGCDIAKSSGGSIDDCVKLTVYLKDLENFSTVNNVMEKYLSKPYPSRAAIEVSRLPKDVQVEIDAVLFKE